MSTAATSITEYRFDYDWKTVVKAYWDKYPNKLHDFVKYSKVVDMHLQDDGTIKVERVQYVQKWSYLWCYTLEELNFDFTNKVMDLKSTVIKKSSLIPVSGGEENIRYQAFQDLKEACEKTLYTKKIAVQGQVQKIAGKLGDGYKKGIQAVEENCEKFKNISLQDWVEKLSL